MPHNGNFNPLLHENYSLGMKPQSGHLKGRKKTWAKILSKIDESRVGVLQKKLLNPTNAFKILLPGIHNSRKSETMNPRIPHQTCVTQKALIDNTGTCFDTAAQVRFLWLLFYTKSTIAVRKFIIQHQ